MAPCLFDHDTLLLCVCPRVCACVSGVSRAVVLESSMPAEVQATALAAATAGLELMTNDPTLVGTHVKVRVCACVCVCVRVLRC